MASSQAKLAVHALAGWRQLALWPLAMVLRAWTLTLKIEPSTGSLGKVDALRGAVIFALWHNRLFTIAELFRRHSRWRRIHGLISPSRDGAWLEAFFSLVGISAVRGSSHKRGREAALDLIEALRVGNAVGITPDGPRGPIYKFKQGGFVLAQRTGAPLVLIGCAYESAWQLGSWDRFFVPRPFSRVGVRYDVIPGEDIAAGRVTIEQVEARLLALNSDGAARATETVVV